MLRRPLARLTGRLQPAIERITSNPHVRRWFPALADSDLWHLNRRSVARAVAVGLFCGLIPGPLQVPGAIVACLVVRANFPLAVVTTFYTNPFTIVPIYFVAYQYGRLVLPGAAPTAAWTPPTTSADLSAWLPALLQWMEALGPPLAVGLALLAVTLAALGWLLARLAWRFHAVWAWRRRSRIRTLGESS